MAFLREDEPPRGVALDVMPGVRRVVADNPGRMTYHGTNSYLIEDSEGGLSLLDPGPASAAHVAALVEAGAGRIRRILLTHSHADHLGATAALKAAVQAPVYAWHASADATFAPDVGLRDGDTVAGLTAVFTPGHAADHLCFAWGDGILFSGDHVMGWSSTIVSPPLGDMAAYLDNLALLLERADRLYLCGHGPPLPDPHPYLHSLIAHRQRREAGILQAVSIHPATTADLMTRLYGKADPVLQRAAERNVLSHLLKLRDEGKVAQDGALWCGTPALTPSR
jgi:glyoxylase-like metal-dependent hydrolase (beta-lactamase superfamily II)